MKSTSLFACLVVLLLGLASVAGFERSAAAGTVLSPAGSVSGYIVPGAEPAVSTVLPWHTNDDRTYDNIKSTFWNQRYRPGKGEIELRGLEFQQVDYDPKSPGSSALGVGTIRQFHHMLFFRGVLIENLVLLAGGGLNQLAIDVDDGSEDRFYHYDGFTFEVGGEYAIPLVFSTPAVRDDGSVDPDDKVSNPFTIFFRASWRIFEGTRPDTASNNDVAYGQQINVQALLAFEIIGATNAESLSLVVFGGAGWHYTTVRWEFQGNEEALNYDAPSIEFLAGLELRFNQFFGITVEARFVGPFVLQGSLRFTF
jgi:hypothetical protein